MNEIVTALRCNNVLNRNRNNVQSMTMSLDTTINMNNEHSMNCFKVVGPSARRVLAIYLKLMIVYDVAVFACPFHVRSNGTHLYHVPAPPTSASNNNNNNINP